MQLPTSPHKAPAITDYNKRFVVNAIEPSKNECDPLTDLILTTLPWALQRTAENGGGDAMSVPRLQSCAQGFSAS